MTEYVLSRIKSVAGPSFNQAAAILAKNPEVVVSNSDGASFTIKTDSWTLREVAQQLPGWNAFRKGDTYGC